MPFAQQNNRIVIAYSPLAQGLLSGNYTASNRPGGVRKFNRLFGSDNLQRAQPLLDTLRETAKNHGAKPAQIALAWLLSQPQVVVIPGASGVAQLELNVAAADIELSADEIAELTRQAEAFQPVSTIGTLLSSARDKIRP